VCFTQQILSDWPTCKVKIQGKTFSGLLNTGADVSIITSRQWPDDWPLTEPQEKISGLEESQQLAQSSAILPCLGPDKRLAQWHLVLTNEEKTNYMMPRMGHQLGKGLGRNLQGDPSLPIQPRLDRKGLDIKIFN